MLWFAVWTVLVLGALVVLGLLAWSVFRKGVDLARELGEASELLAEAGEQAERLGRQQQEPAEPAVFADPATLRRERQRRPPARTGPSRAGRRARPATRRR